MAQNVTTYSVTAPGFMGLNTMDAPVDMDAKFALEANNCVIDKFGRIGARKGWTPSHTTNTDLATSNVECIGELVANDGTRTILAAGGGYLFKLSGTTLSTLVYDGSGAAPTILANNWQFCCLNGVAMFWQRGYDALIYDPARPTKFRRLSEQASYAGTAPQANCALSAFGRVWVADTTTDKNTVTWSDTLTFQVWTGGTAGSLNLLQVWPQGGDEIVALAQHNNNLIIFGTKQVLVYSGADDPSTMKLSDSLSSIGCVGRDTVQNTGADIIFLSDSGVRGLLRTIQEKSAPLRTVSRNVNDDIQRYLASEADGSTIKSIYSPIDAFYLLTFTTSSVTYCFDMRSALEDGSSRVTTWSGMRPKSFAYSKDRVLYMGQTGWLSDYSGYYDNAAYYRMSYYTSWVDFGNPIQISILKKMAMTLFGTVNQNVVYKWGFDYITGGRSQTTTIGAGDTPSEYGVAEYGISEYTRNLIVNRLAVNAGGAGQVIQVGMEAQLQGYPISIQRVDIYTKEGKIR